MLLTATRGFAMIHTVFVSSHVQAQGPLIERLPDGRLLIEAGGRRVAGHPPTRPGPQTSGWKGIIAAALLGLSALGGDAAQLRADTLLNVSYDPTREFYREYNGWFAQWWQAQGNPAATIQTSHGGSGAQARAVIDGIAAQVRSAPRRPYALNVGGQMLVMPKDRPDEIGNEMIAIARKIKLLLAACQDSAVRVWRYQPFSGGGCPEGRLRSGGRIIKQAVRAARMNVHQVQDMPVML